MIDGEKGISTLDGKKDCPCPKIVREAQGVALGVQVGYADWNKATPRQERPPPSIGQQFGQ